MTWWERAAWSLPMWLCTCVVLEQARTALARAHGLGTRLSGRTLWDAGMVHVGRRQRRRRHRRPV
eukprot:13484998-Alexandrium_andersonii.AAC.1